MSKLKKIASHLFPVQQGSYTDKDGNLLIVEMHKGRYRLSTQYAVYSFDDLYENFYNTFIKLNLNKFKDGHVLILGGGLGSIPFMLEKKFQFDAAYMIIEYDVNIIHLFNIYTLPRLKSFIQIMQMDAAMAVAVLEDKYDMIIVDVFVHDEIPDHILTEEFLQNCAENLAIGGIVLFNWMTVTKKLREACQMYFTHVFQPIFENAFINHTTYNSIIVSDKKYLKS